MGSMYYQNKSKKYTYMLTNSHIGSNNINKYGNLHGYETNKNGNYTDLERVMDGVRKVYGN